MGTVRQVRSASDGRQPMKFLAPSGTVYAFPTLLGSVKGKMMDLRVERRGIETVERRREEEEEEVESIYKVIVRTDEKLVEWEVKLPGLLA
jgi:hypothetical protein